MSDALLLRGDTSPSTKVPTDVLGLRVLQEPGQPVLTTDSGALVAAERGHGGLRAGAAVEVHLAGADPPGDVHRPTEIPRPDGPTEPEVGVVGDAHGLGLVVEGDHHDDRTEDLLARDRVVVGEA